LKRDFSSIDKISFSNICVENSTELHYFGIIKKHCAFYICKFTCISNPDIDGVNIMVSCSPFIRPFESSISVVRWLHHSLHFMTSSVKDEVKCWKVPENLDIDLVYEGVVMVASQEKSSIQ
jgi:hypothetical protein